MLALEAIDCDCPDGPCGWQHTRLIDMPDEGDD